jgi:hypothetical protein
MKKRTIKAIEKSGGKHTFKIILHYRFVLIHSSNNVIIYPTEPSLKKLKAEGGEAALPAFEGICDGAMRIFPWLTTLSCRHQAEERRRRDLIR